MGRARITSPDRLAAELVRGAVDAGGLLVCTDFDGSLAPIVQRPEQARALPRALAAVAWLTRAGARDGVGARCPVGLAVVTGRDSDDAAHRLELGPEGVASGNLGLERWSGGRVELEEGVEDWLPALAAATAELEAALEAGRLPGARLERKRCSAVIHTRGLGSAAEAEALELATAVAGTCGLTVTTGKRAAEVRVPVGRDKGSAVADLRAAGWEAAALCAAGDDGGDIPMLRIACAAAPLGTAVAVADAEVPAEVLAAAAHTVDGPWAWAQALELLVEGLRRREPA
ncbi:MAG TPA: trehalose-phosphatase [Candidatus Dormibacteraeota bacterium]